MNGANIWRAAIENGVAAALGSKSPWTIYEMILWMLPEREISIADLARISGLSDASVKVALTVLKKLGLISFNKGTAGKNIYTVAPLTPEIISRVTKGLRACEERENSRTQRHSPRTGRGTTETKPDVPTMPVPQFPGLPDMSPPTMEDLFGDGEGVVQAERLSGPLAADQEDLEELDLTDEDREWLSKLENLEVADGPDDFASEDE